MDTETPKLTEMQRYALKLMQRRAEDGMRPHGRGGNATGAFGRDVFVNYAVAGRLWVAGLIAVRRTDERGRPAEFDLTEKGRCYGR